MFIIYIHYADRASFIGPFYLWETAMEYAQDLINKLQAEGKAYITPCDGEWQADFTDWYNKYPQMIAVVPVQDPRDPAFLAKKE